MMFDTYKFPTREVIRHTHATVIQNRAPTDESIKLLKEMEEKIRKSIISTFRVKTNNFICDVIAFKDIMGNCLTIVTKYSLNETEHTVTTNVDMFDLIKDKMEPQVIWDAVKSDVANSIAEQMLLEPFIKALEPFHGRL